MRHNFSRIIIATRNAGKAAEFRSMLSPLGIEVQSLLDIDAKLPEVEEDGETFAANAEKKARFAAQALGIPALADDSGLCVDALGGAPGVRSARYAGEPSSDERNNAKLLQELAQLGEVGAEGATGGTEGTKLTGTTGAAGGAGPRLLSPAQFVCALALHDPQSGESLHSEGVCPGYIIPEPRGDHGFGYDPLFFVPEYGKTFAEMSEAEKNRISHRGKALEELKAVLQQN